MKDSDFHKIVEFSNAGGGLLPVNELAIEICDLSRKGEILQFIEVTARDLKFHRCYFSLLNFIYSYLPEKFKRKVPENRFYQFVKHLEGKFETIYTFEDGSSLNEYESISFGNMSQKRFEMFIREQLPFIYQNIIAKFYEGKIYYGIIETIEEQYQIFLSKL